MCHVQLNCLTFLDIKNAMVLILGVLFSHSHIICEKKNWSRGAIKIYGQT